MPEQWIVVYPQDTGDRARPAPRLINVGQRIPASRRLVRRAVSYFLCPKTLADAVEL